MATTKRATRHKATVTRSSTGKISKEEIDLRNDVEHQPVDDLQDITNPAYVRVNAGVTKSVGKFESIRVDVSVEMPCAPDEKAIKRTYRQASELVDGYMDKEIEYAKERMAQ